MTIPVLTNTIKVSIKLAQLGGVMLPEGGQDGQPFVFDKLDWDDIPDEVKGTVKKE